MGKQKVKISLSEGTVFGMEIGGIVERRYKSMSQNERKVFKVALRVAVGNIINLILECRK